MKLILAASLALALPASAEAQQEQQDEIYVPRNSIVRSVRPPGPSAEALELGRRLAEAVQEPELGRRLEEARQRVGLRVQEPEQASTRIVARGRLRPAEQWELDAFQTMVDRLALAYAERFPIAALRQMVAFFESPSGRSFTAARPEILAQVGGWLEGPEFEGRLREAVCGKPPPSGPADGPDRTYVRIEQPAPQRRSCVAD